MKNISLIFFFFLSQLFFSQNKDLDSLFKLLPKVNTDTARIIVLGQISEQCDFKDIQKYSNQVLDLAKKNKSTDPKSKRIFLRETARAYNNMGVYYYTISRAIDALDFYQKGALILEKDSIDNELLNSLYNNIAGIEMQIEENDKALITIRKCLQTDIQLKKPLYMATDYHNLSGIYKSLNKIDSALYYGLKSIEVREADLKTINDLEESTLITYYVNVSSIYSSYKKNSTSAEKYIDKAYKLALKTSDTSSFSSVNYWKGRILLDQQKYKEAKPYLENALKYANDNRRVQNYLFAYRGLNEISDSLKDYKNAYRYYKLYKVYADSSMNINTRKEAQVKQLRFEFETKEISLKSNHEKQMAVEQAREQKQRIIIWFIIAFLIIVLFSGLFIFRNYLQKKKINKELEIKNHLIEQQKELVEEKQKQIVDSINYAQHIQHSILADENEIKTYLEDFFVLYLPKDIVSGDFYWFTKQGPELFFATVDCTGHGVPGAFLSMVGSTLLKEIVNFKKITDPYAIIENLGEGIKNTLINTDKNELFVDGMDISICKLNLNNSLLHFASVNHTAYIVNENGLSQLDPQIKSVHGVFAANSKAGVGTIELFVKPGSMIYMSSDGYADQVGEQTKKKMMAPRLKEVLSLAYKLPIKEQKKLLEKTLMEWKGNRKQNDDILLLGFRIP